MADRPERSLSRLLAVSHIASLSASFSIQFRGLDIILVRYDAIPSGSFSLDLLLSSLLAFHDERLSVRWERIERRE